MKRIFAKSWLAGAALLIAAAQPAIASPDYAPAIWNPAASCNYQAGRYTAVTHVTIHTMEGSYASAISWFQNCSAQVSAHYAARSSDGQITQMVRQGDTAWHVGSENGYTVGIEHEGYVADPGTWYTTAMYNASSALTRSILASLGQPQKVYDGSLGWNAVPPTTNYNVKGHVNYPNQTHTDPGSGWDWPRYRSLVGSSGGSMNATRGTITGMNNLCVDIPNSVTTDGTKIQLWGCNGATAQQWHTTTASEIRNPLANKCMVLGNNGTDANGTPILEWTCGGLADQKWLTKNMEVVAGNSGKCLDVPNGSWVAGAVLRLWSCNGTAAQKFTFDTPTGTLRGPNNMCVNVTGANSSNGIALQLATCNGAASENWIPGNGGFRTALNTNRCMDINANSTADGAKVQIWDCQANGPAQQWALRGQLEDKLGRCLDTPASNGVAGQALQLWDCNGGAAQKWTMWMAP